MNSTMTSESSETPSFILNENTTEEQKNKFMLKYIKEFRFNTKTEIFETLLRAGVSPNLLNSQGKSLLMMAAEKGSIELVQELLDSRADVSLRDRQGKTALFYAIEAAHENLDVISLLLEEHADPNAETNDGRTPLIRAIEKDYCETAKLLLEKGASADVQLHNTGDTALHLAVKKDNKNMVDLLIQYQCNLRRKNKQKETALDLCKENSEIRELLQSLLPKSNQPGPQIVDAQSAIEEFLQIKSQRTEKAEHDVETSGEPVLGSTSENEKQSEMQETGKLKNKSQNQNQEQNVNSGNPVKNQQKQSQENKKQNQQLNQKKSPQQKPEKDIPRKYGRNEMLGIQRTQSNVETSQKDSLFDAKVNLSPNKTNNSIMTTFNFTNPQHSGINQEYSIPLNMQSSTEDSSIRQSPVLGNRQGQFHKPNEENIQSSSQSQKQQSQMKRVNMTGSSELLAPKTNSDKFPERELVSSHLNIPSNEYPFPYQHQQQQQIQGGVPNIPGNQVGGFNPAQMKGNMSPGFYNNPQFIHNNQSPGQPQQFKNKKQKGGNNPHNNAPNNPNMPMNINPNIQNKNFPINPYPINQPPNQQTPQNFNQNQFRANPENKFVPEQSNNPRPGPKNQGNPSSNNPSFNRNQERNIPENLQQRAVNGPQNFTLSNNGGLINVSEISEHQNIPNDITGMEKIPPNVRNFEDNKNLKQRPQNQPQNQPQHQHQQQQNNIYKGNPNNNIMFNQGSPFVEGRTMNNMSVTGPNPAMFTNFHQQQPQMTMNIGNVGPNMGQHHFMPPFSPNMTPSRGQQGLNQMMGKPQPPMQPFITYPGHGGMQRNMHNVFHFNPEDPVQSENNKLNANIISIVSNAKNQGKELEKLNAENELLKSTLKDIQINEKNLQDEIVEKEQLIEQLKKENEMLELAFNEASGRLPFLNRQEKGSITDTLFSSFSSVPIEKIVQGEDMNFEIIKRENIIKILHEEVLDYEKAIDEYNAENKELFDSLIKLLQQSIFESLSEITKDVEFFIYGSYATGLMVPWSDIDIVIKLQPGYYNAFILDHIEGYLKKKKWIEESKLIKALSVPVIKLTCSKQYFNKKIDITLQDQRHNGLLCVELVKEYMITYPALRPLVLVFRQLLSSLNLDGKAKGGLNSYSLILMIVFLFQTRETSAQNPMENQNLGHLVLSFLHMYGLEYDYVHTGVVNPKKLNKASEMGRNAYSLEEMGLMNIMNQFQANQLEPKIIIQDPITVNNNVGRSIYQIKQIKHFFMAAYFEAHKPCICEIHKRINNLVTGDESATKQHNCGTLLGKMLRSFQPWK